MNYQAFTNASLTMMHPGIRGALAADDALSDLGAECKFRVRRPRSGKCTLLLSTKCVRGSSGKFDTLRVAVEQSDVAVAESGSMAKASARLAISHPVISKTISDLEHTLEHDMKVPQPDVAADAIRPIHFWPLVWRLQGCRKIEL